jgi:hypothetical protein
MEEKKENELTKGYIFENKDAYLTKNKRVIRVEIFKKLCKKYGIVDWRKELEKL